ncbi:hypothetical protein HDU98_003025 [Podochytrium sp. JEL0797]|nr:hypothetical protein HDU98_003025 [Podochytrium sp. JEL0797]
MTPSAHSVIKSLKDRTGLNPADAIPKLPAAVILQMEQRGADMSAGDKGGLLKLLMFEEVAADCFVESVREFKGPIDLLHPVEVFVIRVFHCSRETGGGVEDVKAVHPYGQVKEADGGCVATDVKVAEPDVAFAQIKKWNQARLDVGHTEHLKTYIQLVQSTGAEDTVDQVSTKLAQIGVSLHGK